MSPNERWGGSVVKWPAVSANGSKVYGKHIMQFDCTIDCSLITFHGKSVLTVEYKCCICIDGSIGPLSGRRNTTCYDTAGSGVPLVPTIKPSLGWIASNSFINSHRGHHTESCSMKLHLTPRKLIINKITSVMAITDNNCVKEVLRCV